MNIKLYYSPRSRALRPRWLLEELALPYELIHVDIYKGENRAPAFKKMSPYGHVPVLEVDGQPVLESGAICHWLTDQFPGQRLAPLPGTPQRAAYEQWMFYVPGTLEPPAFDYLLHSQLLPENLRIPAMVPWSLKQYQYVVKVLARTFAEKSYILGNQFSTADIMLGSTLLGLRECLDPYPGLQAYTQRLQDRAAYQKAMAP